MLYTKNQIAAEFGFSYVEASTLVNLLAKTGHATEIKREVTPTVETVKVPGVRGRKAMSKADRDRHDMIKTLIRNVGTYADDGEQAKEHLARARIADLVQACEVEPAASVMATLAAIGQPKGEKGSASKLSTEFEILPSGLDILASLAPPSIGVAPVTREESMMFPTDTSEERISLPFPG